MTGGKCDAHLQEELEGGSKELQASQLDLCTEEGHGADGLDHHSTHRTGRIRSSRHGSVTGRLLTDLLGFCDKVTCLWWMRKMLSVLSTWTLLKALTLFATAFSWGNCSWLRQMQSAG